MKQYVPNFIKGNLEFSDFALLAVLIAILYGLTAMEYFRLSKSDLAFGGSRGINLRKAGIWSFYGIISTIIAGWLADMNLSTVTEYPMVIVPLFFIFKWAGFHIKGSKIIDPSVLEKNIESLIDNNIIKQLKMANNCLSAKSIYENLILNEEKFDNVEEIISKSTSSGEIIINRLGLKELISPFLIKMETVNVRLKILKKKGIIILDESTNCYLLKN